MFSPQVHNPTVVGSQWNVGHNGGDYRYNAQKIIDRVFHPSINSAAAIQILHNRNSIDFGSNGSRGRQWNRATTSTRSFSSIFNESIPMSFSTGLSHTPRSMLQGSTSS
ncbi:hypothetical protein E4U30_008064 [Claviceps sp. LM220 group G6]|nr:hypothetical protein E4U30_008064 [Claviceps sp. LM220 group G6]